MADIRIKDLTTTASSTASDDFIAVDGTTNGTRKLNAFSPTFGGNATVTGTLTGNSTATIAGRVISNASSTATDAAGFAHTTGYSSGGKTYTGFSAGGIAVNQSAAFGYVYDSGTPANSFAHITPYGSTEGSLFKFSPAGVLTLGATTASTTTSSGALVVGNGTSGGLGVGGSINAGGNVTISGSNGYAVIGGRQWSFRANSSGGSPASGCVIRDDSAAADRLTIDINGNTSVLATTASTSTSSGALVVSGGVGVAGNLYVGGSTGVVVTTAAYARLTSTTSDAGSAADIRLQNTGASGRDIFLGSQGSTSSIVDARSRFMLYDNTGGGLVLSASGADNVKIHLSTASTSTSSGALVVSGGVGVAGAIYGGGDIISSGNGNIQGGRFTSVNSNSYIEQSGTDFTYVTGGSRPHVFSIGGTTRFQVTTSGIISSLPASAASLTVNSTMTFELTSNTSLKIFVRGSDGTTRSTTLTLA